MFHTIPAPDCRDDCEFGHTTARENFETQTSVKKHKYAAHINESPKKGELLFYQYALELLTNLPWEELELKGRTNQ